MRSYRQRVAAYKLSLVVIYLCCGNLCAVFALDHDLLAELGCLISLYTISHTFIDILETNLTTLFRYDDCIEGVPFANHVAWLHCISIVEEKFRTVRYIGIHQNDSGLRLHNTELTHTTDNDIHSIGILDGSEFLDLKFAVITRGDILDSGNVTGDTTDVECTECKLGTRLTD